MPLLFLTYKPNLSVFFYALLEFDASQVEEAGKAFEVCEKADWVQDAVLSQTEHQARELWQLREGISESIASYTPYKNPLSVRIEDVPEFLEEVDAYVANSYPNFEVCWYGHIGDGNLHLNILRPEELSIENFFELGHEMSPRIFELVSSKRGSISAEHGVGLLKKDFLCLLELLRESNSLFLSKILQTLKCTTHFSQVLLNFCKNLKHHHL